VFLIEASWSGIEGEAAGWKVGEPTPFLTMAHLLIDPSRR